MENTENKVNLEKNVDLKKVKNIFCELFKFDKLFFKNFIFYIHIVAQVLILFTYLFWASQNWVLSFILAVVFYPIVFFMVRFSFEFLAVLFSINDNLFEIRTNTKK